MLERIIGNLKSIIDWSLNFAVKNLTALEFDYQQRMIESSQHQCGTKGYRDEEDLKNNKELLRFYTSLHSFTVLMSVYKMIATPFTASAISKLSKFQCFILTLMKLRLNSSNYDLGFRFSISESTVSRVFARWIEAMDIRLSFLILWPDQAVLQKTMPFCYRLHYGLKVASIIDCFEIFVEKPTKHGRNINTIIQQSILSALYHKAQLILYLMDGEVGFLTSILLKTLDT